MITAARKDANHKEIVTAMRKIGAAVIDTSQIKKAFDCLVIFQGNTFIMEIKDGAKPPSARKLTEGEIECKNLIESRGGKYHVIKSVDEALELITK